MWVVIYGFRGAELQVGVQACQVQEPPDDRFRASDDEAMPAFGLAFVCPDQDRKTSAIGEAKPQSTARI